MNPANAATGAANAPEVRAQTPPAASAPAARLTPMQRWAKLSVLKLRAHKLHMIATGDWPATALFWPYPTPCSAVEDVRHGGQFDGMTENERRLLHTMRDVAQGSFARISQASGRVIGEHNYMVLGSYRDWANAAGMSFHCTRTAIDGLIRKKLIRRLRERSRGETGAQNREKSEYEVLHYAAVREARKADPQIGKDVRGYVWATGYQRSRRFLTAEELTKWSIDVLMPQYDRPANVPEDVPAPVKAAPEKKREAEPVQAAPEKKREAEPASAEPSSAHPPPRHPDLPHDLEPQQLEAYILQVTGNDTRWRELILMAREVAAGRNEELHNGEIGALVRFIHEKAVRSNGRKIHTVGYYKVGLPAQTRQYLDWRWQLLAKQPADGGNPTREETETLNTIRGLLRNGGVPSDPMDPLDLEFYRRNTPDLVKRVEDELLRQEGE